MQRPWGGTVHGTFKDPGQPDLHCPSGAGAAKGQGRGPERGSQSRAT